MGYIVKSKPLDATGTNPISTKKKSGDASQPQSTCLYAQDLSVLHSTAKGRKGKEKRCLQLDSPPDSHMTKQKEPL